MFNMNLQRYNWEPYAGKPHVRFCGGAAAVMLLSTLETSLLKTIDEPTLCLDFEAGLLAVQGCWDGDSISVRTWEDARDIACLIGGVNPASKSCYGQKHFDMAKAKFKDCNFSKYRCIFIDSITIASKICLMW